jgi:hypothetical protein
MEDFVAARGRYLIRNNVDCDFNNIILHCSTKVHCSDRPMEPSGLILDPLPQHHGKQWLQFPSSNLVKAPPRLFQHHLMK